MPHLIEETVGRVRILRLDRPERRNALTYSLGWSIVQAISDARWDDDVEHGQEAVQAIVKKPTPEFRGR